jgi:hypothetical protein
MKPLLASAIAACLLTIGAAAPENVTVTVERARPEGVSRLELGVTHTQRSLDTGGDAAAIARAEKLLAAVCRYQNVHIMGWGTMNPNPAPGVYDWESLDRRMRMVRSIPGTVPVITLCAAPDWMKGGKPGETDWSKIEVAPIPAHFADFATLAAAVARRYPDVKHFQVWNEFKGFWDRARNNWHFEHYTEMYNRVYDALKAVNPEIRVGGPYLVIEGSGSESGGWATEKPIRARQWEVLDHWLKHKHGAEFFVIDRSLRSSHDTNTYTEAEHRSRTPLFGDIVRQIRQRTELPIWYAEFYAGRHGGSPEESAAVNASVLLHMVRSGVSVALLWGVTGAGDLGHALLSDTRQPGGGAPSPLYTVFQILRDHFGPGTSLVRATSSAPDVEVLASADQTLLINKRLDAVTVTLDGKQFPLAANEVRLIRRAGD